MNIDVYTLKGKGTAMKVSDDIFVVDVKPSTISKLFHVGEVNKRKSLSNVLTKSEVRGGGRKPYRQKGTGNARQGSITNPHYKGGGVAFGPKANRNFSRGIPKKESRKALLGALHEVGNEGKMMIVDVDTSKTLVKDYKGLLEGMPKGRSYVIYDVPSPMMKALSNVANVEVKNVGTINVRGLLTHEYVGFTKDAMEQFTKSLSSNK